MHQPVSVAGEYKQRQTCPTHRRWALSLKSPNLNVLRYQSQTYVELTNSLSPSYMTGIIAAYRAHSRSTDNLLFFFIF